MEKRSPSFLLKRLVAALVGWFPLANRNCCDRPPRAGTSGATPRNNQPEAAAHHRLRPKRARLAPSSG